MSRSDAKKATRASLEQAIKEIQGAGKRVTITAVAGKAGVSAPLIHNTYTDLAEKIRKLGGRALRSQRDEARGELAKLREENKRLRAEKELGETQMRKLASLLEQMRFDIARLRGVAHQKVSEISGARRKRSPE